MSCLGFWNFQCHHVSGVSVCVFVLLRLKLSYPGSTCGCRSSYNQQVLNTHPAMIEQWTSRDSLLGARVIGLSQKRRDSMVRDTWPLKFKAAGFFCWIEMGDFLPVSFLFNCERWKSVESITSVVWARDFSRFETVGFLALVWVLWLEEWPGWEL